MLKRELGLTERDIVDIPQLFYRQGPYAEAFFPNMVRAWAFFPVPGPPSVLLGCRLGVQRRSAPCTVYKDRGTEARVARTPPQCLWAFCANTGGLHQWFSTSGHFVPWGIWIAARRGVLPACRGWSAGMLLNTSRAQGSPHH